MTLKYSLFGVPGNLDELVDYAKRKGDGKVDVLLESCVYNDSFALTHEFVVSVVSGGRKLRIDNRSCYSARLRRLIEGESFRKALETAERLSSVYGLSVSVNNQSVEMAQSRLNDFLV